LESEANQESENDKFNRVDLLAKDNRDELILIEVQYDSQQDYFHRMLYGASKLICEYMEKGEDYGKVKKVYSVNIVYFALAKGLKKAKETLDIMKLNDKERIAYNRKLENKSLEKSLFKSALMEHEYETKIEIAKTYWIYWMLRLSL